MFIRSGVAAEPFSVTREAVLAGCFRESRKSSDGPKLTETFCRGPARVDVLRFKARQVPALKKSVSGTKDGTDNHQEGHGPYQKSPSSLSTRCLWHGNLTFPMSYLVSSKTKPPSTPRRERAACGSSLSHFRS